MIRMLLRNGKTCPIIVCDICGDMIGEAEDGAAVFPDVFEENTKYDVLHAHKGDCHDIAEERLGGDATGWQELAHHLVWLCRNTEIDGGDFDRLGKLMP